jgi:ribonuclease HII
MTSAVARLSPVKVFVDGNYLPKGITCEAEAVVKGDGKYACIAAASILAKNTRDDLMRSMAAQYPDYGFDRHFGYATPEHMEALRKFGPCEIHRRSFAPVRDWEQPCLTFDA